MGISWIGVLIRIRRILGLLKVDVFVVFDIWKFCGDFPLNQSENLVEHKIAGKLCLDKLSAVKWHLMHLLRCYVVYSVRLTYRSEKKNDCLMHILYLSNGFQNKYIHTVRL